MEKVKKIFLAIILVGLTWGAATQPSTWDWIDKTLFVNQLYLTAYDMEQSIQWVHNTPADEEIFTENNIVYEKKTLYKESNPLLKPFIHDPVQVWAVAALWEGYLFYRWKFQVHNKWHRRAEMLLWTALEIYSIEQSSRTIHMAYKWSF